jgi:hypothetical protein
MRLEVIGKRFSVCKVKDCSKVDLGEPFVFVSRTDQELSLVCPTASVPPNCVARDDGWSAMRVEGTLDFSLIGVLSRMTTALAEASIGVFAISTYDTDYLLVKEVQLDSALDALAKAGFLRASA